MSPLVPCPGCARHVRAAERACPFCDSALPTDLAASAVPAATTRMKRAAVFTFATSLALAGCGSTTTSNDASVTADTSADTGPSTDNGPATDTGFDSGIFVDAGTDAGAPDDDGGPVAAYGAPPDVGFPDEDGGIAPPYGIPPKDAGDQDDVPSSPEVGVRYGAPPPPDAG